MRRDTWLAGVFLCVLSLTGLAQSRGSDTSAFLAAAKRGAAKYQSPEAAIADGYRPVGVEFPAMGEHWVNLARVMADTIDAERPSVLIYVSIDGKQRLGGVGFTDLLRPGELLPSRPAGGFWHEHNGTVAEESFPLHHQMGSAAATGADALRLAILHVWTHAANPAGSFATDNWTLPALRLSKPGASLSAAATRGLALGQDATGYYELMLRTALHPSEDEEAIIEKAVSEARDAAGRPTREYAQGKRDAESALAAVWNGLWRTLADRLPRHRGALRSLQAQL